MAFYDKVPAKSVYKISEDVINKDKNQYQYQYVCSIHRNSGFVFYPIYFLSYLLEIIYTLKMSFSITIILFSSTSIETNFFIKFVTKFNCSLNGTVFVSFKHFISFIKSEFICSSIRFDKLVSKLQLI